MVLFGRGADRIAEADALEAEIERLDRLTLSTGGRGDGRAFGPVPSGRTPRKRRRWAGGRRRRGRPSWVVDAMAPDGTKGVDERDTPAT